MKKHLTKAILILFSFPLIASAETSVTNFSKLGQFIDDFKNNVIVNLSSLLLTTAVVAFFYGIVRYMFSIRNGEKVGVTDGKNFMLWGLIAIFVMFSVWGIVTFSQTLFGIQNTTTISVPSINFNGGTGGGTTGGTNSGVTGTNTILLQNGATCTGHWQCSSGSCFTQMNNSSIKLCM